MMDSTDLLNSKDEEIDQTDTELDNEDSASEVSDQSVSSTDSTHDSDGGILPPRVIEPVANVLKLADSQRNVYYAPEVSSGESNLLMQESADNTSDDSEPLETQTRTTPVSNTFVKPIIEPISAVTKRSNAGRKRVFDDEERRQRYNAYHRHLYQKQKLERQKRDQELALLKRKLNMLTQAPKAEPTPVSQKQMSSRFESSFQSPPCSLTYVWKYSGSNGDSAVEEFTSMDQMADALRDVCGALQRKGVLTTFSLTQK